MQRIRTILNEENLDIIENYYHPKLYYPTSGRKMQLDIWIPKYSLALEYQGKQHFINRKNFGHPSQQLRDVEKKQACESSSITLIMIPYWWDFRVESLAATIHQARSDIPISKFIKLGAPISNYCESKEET
jgi:hypothetical protein